ncbi:hypothetical protein ACEQUB_01745 [Ralstonia syzygii]
MYLSLLSDKLPSSSWSDLHGHAASLGAATVGPPQVAAQSPGLTQAQLGALINVSQNRIADIEKDPGAVGFEQLLRLLHALGAQLLVRTAVAADTAAAPAADW